MSGTNGAGLGGGLFSNGTLRPEMGRLALVRSVGQWRRPFGSVEPATLHGIIRQVEQGELQDWADLAAWMLYTDPTVRTGVRMRINAVAGADFEVLPGLAREGEDALAEEAAHAFREQLESTPDLERLFSDLLMGSFLGWAGAEHMWRPDGRMWVSRPEWLDPREFRFRRDGAVEVRDNRSMGAGQWVTIAAHPGKFLLHVPRNISTAATLAGDLLAVTWPWLFKRWAEKFWLGALDKAGAPWIYGQVPRNATAAIRADRLSGIEGMSGGGAAVVERDATDPEPFGVLDVTDAVKDGYAPAIEHWNTEIIKGLVGSTDNVEADHGSNARAESQGEQTILPNNQSDAKRLCGTIERDWAAWFCRYNAGYFGRVPPIPRLAFTLVKEAELRAPIYQYHLKGRIVTRNDVRAQLGLDPLPKEQGGDELLDIQDQPSAAGGADAAAPFSQQSQRQLTAARDRKPRQMRLPMTSRATTSRTTSASVPSPLASALRSPSGDPAK